MKAAMYFDLINITFRRTIKPETSESQWLISHDQLIVRDSIVSDSTSSFGPTQRLTDFWHLASVFHGEEIGVELTREKGRIL